MKVISFSLWGDDPKYNVGMVRNAEIAAQLFPDWCIRLHYVLGEQPPAVNQIWNSPAFPGMPNVELMPRRNREDKGDWRGMFWRFEDAFDPEVEVMISRDCDSRLSLREKAAIDDWLESDKSFHCMRDHIWHNRPVLGGMWGAKRGFLPNFEQLLANAKKEDRWQTDQDFLNDIIWPLVEENAMQHDSYYRRLWGGRPFPTPRDNGQFVGEIIDENEKPNWEHRGMLR